MLIGPLGINISEMLIEIHKFSFKKIHLKMSSGKWRPLCLGLNVLNQLSCTCITGNKQLPELDLHGKYLSDDSVSLDLIDVKYIVSAIDAAMKQTII